MAKYHDSGISDVSFLAATNLSGLQYYFVNGGSITGEVASATGASNPTPLGVLQNAPSAGQEARVRIFGPSKLFCVTGGTCAIGNWRYVGSNACGQGIGLASETGDIALGRNIGASMAVSASRFLEVFLYGSGTCPAAAC